MNDRPGTRRYDEKEVRRLLERAAELHGTAPATRPQTGLTLGELEEIAAEAGLDVASLRQAARELDARASAGEATLGTRLAGGPLRQVLERTVPVEADPSVFADLLLLVQRAADVPGQASQVGRTLSWTSQNPNGVRQLQVMITARDGGTHLWIEERYTGLAGALFGGGVGGFGFGVGAGLGGGLGGALGSLTLGLGIPALVVGGSYVICRKVFGTFVSRRGRVLTRLLDDLTARIEA